MPLKAGHDNKTDLFLATYLKENCANQGYLAQGRHNRYPWMRCHGPKAHFMHSSACNRKTMLQALAANWSVSAPSWPTKLPQPCEQRDCLRLEAGWHVWKKEQLQNHLFFLQILYFPSQSVQTVETKEVLLPSRGPPLLSGSCSCRGIGEADLHQPLLMHFIPHLC